MKKEMIAAVLLAATMLTACGAKGEESIRTAGAVNADFESTKVGEEISVDQIKQKYAAEEADEGESQDIMPLYNVAEDQVFDFTFQVDFYDLENTFQVDYYDLSDIVTIHTDKECKPESELAVYYDMVENEQGFTISLAPVSAVLETVYNEEDEEQNEHAVWGNAPVYYIAIWYDTESTETKRLDKPQIIPFTVKHKVQAPEVEGVVDTNGRFSLQWEPVEGAEEYRIYNLGDGNQWTASYNEPVDSAKSGYTNCSLSYITSTTDTSFADFGENGNDGLVMHERSTSGKIYYIGQNFGVGGEYYVSAVVDGVESGFACAVKTADLKIPCKLSDESDIMFTRYDEASELPLTLDVVNIDGSVSKRNVFYTFQLENTWIEGMKTPEYAFAIEGTMLTGCVSMNGGSEREFPESIGSKSPIGNAEPENDIPKQPDADVETILEEKSGIGVSGLIEQQKENTKKHKEKGDKTTTKTTDEKYLIFADNAEEEWLARNLINGETEISLEAFPNLQYPENLEDVFYKVYYQNPYVLGVTKFGYDYKEMTFHVTYAYSQDEMDSMREEIYDEAVNILEETVTEDMSEEEKRTAIYEYLEENCEYDYGALEDAEKSNYKKNGDSEYEYAFNTYGIIVKKLGVCQSYAYAYKLLCSMSGVECNVMTGYLDGSLPHAWNVVRINDEWYQTDSTNNAKTTGIPFFLYNSDSETARQTGFTGDDMYELDDVLEEYESDNQEYEYYYANDRYAEDLEEYVSVLEALIDTTEDNICVRYSGAEPDISEFEEAVVEVFYRRNMEDKLSELGYVIGNDFIVLTQ